MSDDKLKEIAERLRAEWGNKPAIDVDKYLAALVAALTQARDLGRLRAALSSDFNEGYIKRLHEENGALVARAEAAYQAGRNDEAADRNNLP